MGGGAVRRTALGVVLLLGALPTPIAAHAQSSPAPVGVSIAPARIERDQQTRAVTQSFLIVNHEDEARRITLSVAGLGHDLDGTPEFLEPAPATAALRLDATSFVLDPGARRIVNTSGAIPNGDRALYAAVIAEFAPLQQQTGTVESRSRVAAMMLVRGPRPWIETVSIEDAGFLPGPNDETLTVFAAVRNTGNVHQRPSGTARISKDGVVLATVSLRPDVIIPGFSRRLTATWKPPAGLTGNVTLDVTTAPAAHRTVTVSFDKGSAQRPQAQIVNLRAHDRSGALVTLTVVNTGTVPVAPAVTLVATQDANERARTVLVPQTIQPGKAVDLEWRPGLDDGVYLITAQARSGELLLDEASAGLRLGAEPGVGTQGDARAVSPAKPVLAIVAGILALLCAAWVVLVWKRRRRDDEEPPEQQRLAA